MNIHRAERNCYTNTVNVIELLACTKNRSGHFVPTYVLATF